MREIEFRGKRSSNGQWAYGYYSKADFGPEGIKHIIDTTDGYHDDIDPKTLGEYTGIRDNNGNKIYEDDITKDEFDRVACITWKENEARFAMRYVGQKTEYRMFINHLRTEVIGNIYENPELLEDTHE